MNEREAARVAQLAQECFLSLVRVRLVDTVSDAGRHRRGVELFHKVLERRVILYETEDWPAMRDCWLVATDREPIRPYTPPKTPGNLWAFWH